MEAAEVDQSVGAEEEVGDDGSDGVQLSWPRERTGGGRPWFTFIFKAVKLLRMTFLFPFTQVLFKASPMRMKQTAMMYARR